MVVKSHFFLLHHLIYNEVDNAVVMKFIYLKNYP
jgi:hypothetical protein